MPIVKNPGQLAAVYKAAKEILAAGDIPTRIIPANTFIFRFVHLEYLPEPAPGGHVSKMTAYAAVQSRPGVSTFQSFNNGSY